MRMTSCHAHDIISCALHDFMFMTSFHGQSIISAAVSIISAAVSKTTVFP